MNKNEQEFIIDFKHLIKSLIKKAWLIILAGVIFGASALIYTSNFVAPKYSSSVMLYVNNKSFSLGNTSVNISAADLSASQSLIDTYIGILKTRTTLEEVSDKSGLGYGYGQLLGMISTSKLEGTEIFRVTVTASDPTQAAQIANTISDVLPERIEDIIEGSSMRIVDSAVINNGKVSPDITGNSMRWFLIGCFIAAAVIVLITILDDTIRSEDYILQTYDVPILSKIPDLNDNGTHGGYFGKYKYGYSQKYGKHYGYENSANAVNDSKGGADL